MPDGLMRNVEHEFRLAGIQAAVVDDDPDLLPLLEKMLRREGMIVYSYLSSVQMLTDLKVEKIKPDVILTDFGMPEISGVEVVRRARAIHFGGPIVVLSGWYKDDLEKQLAEEASVYVFQKPFSPREIIGLLENLFLDPHQIQTDNPQRI